MADQQSLPVFKNEPIWVLVLGFVTCGLYLIYWNMKMAEVINAVAGQQKIAPAIAVIGGCCLPINVYFYYLCGETLPALGQRIGDETVKDKSTLLIILAIFVPMVSAMILQGIVNKLYK